MAKILLVDDDVDVRYALGKYLHRAGHQVVEATDGAQALSLMATEAFDLVITDIVMPEADGIELILDIGRNTPGLPVIAISGGGRLGRAEYLDMAQGLGATAGLAKPVDPDELLALIDRLLPR
ncbi:MAG: response regulator [Pseudomonadota bacterium]